MRTIDEKIIARKRLPENILLDMKDELEKYLDMINIEIQRRIDVDKENRLR